jgi:hypothetical protein
MPEPSGASVSMHAKNLASSGGERQPISGRKIHTNGMISLSLKSFTNSSSIPRIQHETQSRYPVQWPQWQKHSQETCKDQYDTDPPHLSPEPYQV